MKGKGVPIVIFLILMLNEVFDSFAQYCFKKTALAQGATSIAGVGDARAFFFSVLGNGYLWLGIAAVAIVFISWTAILAKINLSIASPITSISYVFVALTSLIFLHEHISLMRWLGILLILVGVAVVSFTSEAEEGKRP